MDLKALVPMIEGEEVDSTAVVTSDTIPWRHEMARSFYSLIVQSSDNADARKVLEDALKRERIAVQQVLAMETSLTECTDPQSTSSSVVDCAPEVGDPIPTKTKGRRARIKSSTEQPKKRSKDEFGTSIPKPQLF